MVDKRDNLLEQKRKKIDNEISNILKWIDFENLCIEQQENHIDIARSDAESKSYSEDIKLSILKNIWNSAYENHYWEKMDKKKSLNSTIDDDTKVGEATKLIFDFFWF